jgi:hypothetical protein
VGSSVFALVLFYSTSYDDDSGGYRAEGGGNKRTAPQEPQVLLPSLEAPHLGQSDPCMFALAFDSKGFLCLVLDVLGV